jgi:methylase of polypeptide subunit release factors
MRLMKANKPIATDTAEVAKRVVCDHLKAGDHAVDATCGNGWDTQALAGAVGPEGHVLAIDIQADAIDATRERLHAHQYLERVSLIQESHVRLADRLTGKAQAIMFNLGYLPGGDPSITTHCEDTLPAIQSALACLDKDGLLSIVVYPGHDEGAKEAHAIDAWVAGLEDFRVFSYRRINSRAPAPFAWFIQQG